MSKEYEELREKCLLETQVIPSPTYGDKIDIRAYLEAQHDKTLKLNNEEWVRWIEDRCTFEGRGAGTMTMKIMKWWWEARKKKLGVE